MPVREQSNGSTIWVRIAISVMAIAVSVSGAAVGWFTNELGYMRARIAVLEAQQARTSETRFTEDQGRELRREVLELERLVETKIDAKAASENVAEIRAELLRWQERIDVRLREVETR